MSQRGIYPPPVKSRPKKKRPRLADLDDAIDFFHTQYHVNESGCWMWDGAKTSYGYGLISYNKGEHVYAHRLSMYIYDTLVLSSEKKVCHKCDVPSCVNPKHLFIGTQKENLDDARRKGRTSNPPILRGEECKSAKLTGFVVLVMRRCRERGESCASIARRYGVHVNTVRMATTTKDWGTWRHI